MIDGLRCAQWLARLVQIPSVTPAQAGPKAGEPGEGRIANQVTEWFSAFGGEVHVEDARPGRPNVYAIWRGRGERWAGVDVHTDTVGVEQMSGDPFSGEIRDGRVWGRGAVDTKASLGVILALLEAMHGRGLRPQANLFIAATADEEFGASGAPACAAWLRRHDLRIDQMVVAEPTRCTPVYGHKGLSRFHLTVTGQAAHSSQPELGKNAVTAAAAIVLAYEEEHMRLQAASQETGLGLPKLTVTLMGGGTGINVVPDSCRLSVDRRVVAGERPSEVTARLLALAQDACPLPVHLELHREMDAFLQSPDSDWMHDLARWSGQAPQVAPYGTNAWAYVDLPGERAVLGPGSIDQAHGAEEWVEIGELEKVAGVYARWWGLGDWLTG